MKERLDYFKLTNGMVSEIEVIKNELRSEIILLQTPVEFMIDEIIGISLETDSMKRNKWDFNHIENPP